MKFYISALVGVIIKVHIHYFPKCLKIPARISTNCFVSSIINDNIEESSSSDLLRRYSDSKDFR